jgi:hypothetical protein
LSGGASIAGTTTVATLNATGVTTISNNLSVTNSGTLGVAGLATLSGGATITGALNTISGITTHSNNVVITNGGTLGVVGLTTLSNGLSTTTISTASAYIGTLTVGNESDNGVLNVATLNTTTATTHSNAVAITTGGLTVGGLTTLSNGLSTTTISSSSGYIGSLTVNSLQIGTGASFTTLGDIITTSISNTGVFNQNSLLTVYGNNLATFQGGLSTTTISTASAYIGSLTVGTESDYGTMNVGGQLSATGEIYANGGAMRITGSATTLDLWNYNYISQTSGNMAIATNSNLTINATTTGKSITLTSPTITLIGATNVGGLITGSNGVSTTTISSGSITATNFYGNGSGLTGISGGGSASSNLVVSNVTGTALLNTGTTPTITSNLSGVYFIINNSGFSNIYIWDYVSSGTQAGYYNVLVNQTGTSLTVTTANLNITPSGYITIPPYANTTILYSPSNGYANYIVM